ncbi:DeoR/GlpR family DNA-binding transcription regulator [Oscillospiraceae bacterium PP1C4]
MLAIERLKMIEDILNERGSIVISEISKELGVSEETIRRDLDKLESSNLLHRVRGGAYKVNIADDEVPINIREKMYVEEKKCIADKCINMLKNYDKVMIGSSTTEVYFAKSIVQSQKYVSVITNSLKVLKELENSKYMKAIALGGSLRKATSSFVGASAISQLSTIFAEKAFISCTGLDMNFGVTEDNESEAALKSKMIENSSKVILMVDNTKINFIGTYSICDLKKIDTIVTDVALSDKWVDKLTEADVEIIYAI